MIQHISTQPNIGITLNKLIEDHDNVRQAMQGLVGLVLINDLHVHLTCDRIKEPHMPHAIALYTWHVSTQEDVHKGKMITLVGTYSTYHHPIPYGRAGLKEFRDFIKSIAEKLSNL